MLACRLAVDERHCSSTFGRQLLAVNVWPSTFGNTPMNGLIRASLKNSYAVTVAVLSVVVFGILAVRAIPIDILPVFKSPAVQVLTFYRGMPADNMGRSITFPMERWTGQAAGTS